MSWLMAHFYDRWMAQTEEACLADWRGDLLAEVAGRVLEIGAGTGANLPHYPSRVEQLILTEPDRAMRRKLREKLEDRPSGSGVDVIPAPADDLPFPDGSFDAAVSTLVLCSVPDLERAVEELRRVLRPGGRLFFLEHVAAEDRPRRLRWQRRLEPFWKPLAGNCHLTRRTGAALEERGFTIVTVKRRSMRKAPPIVRPTITGIARR